MRLCSQGPVRHGGRVRGGFNWVSDLRGPETTPEGMEGTDLRPCFVASFFSLSSPLAELEFVFQGHKKPIVNS